MHTASDAWKGDRIRQQGRAFAIPVLAIALALAALLGARVAWGVGVVTVSDPWLKPAAARGTTSVFLVLGSAEHCDVIGVRSADGDAMLARGSARTDAIALRAGEPLAMTPGGPHVVLRHAKRALALGDRVQLTLVLRDAQGRTQEIPVDAEVRRRSALDDERRAHNHHHAH